MVWLLIIIFVLTILDIGLTYIGVKADLITEANPLLQEVFHASPEMTAAFCILLALIFVWFLWKNGEKFKYIKIGLVSLVTVKILVIGFHVHWLLSI